MKQSLPKIIIIYLPSRAFLPKLNEEKISIEKSDPTIFKKINNRKVPIIKYSSKEFLQQSAKINLNFLPKSYTTITTTTVVEKIKTIIPYTSPIITQTINTPTISTISI